MKNLDQYVIKVDQASRQNDFEHARLLCQEMIEHSDAKPTTKRKHRSVLERKPDHLLQFWASDYRLAGLGLKVIK